jgi:hypothetical protein
MTRKISRLQQGLFNLKKNYPIKENEAAHKVPPPPQKGAKITLSAFFLLHILIRKNHLPSPNS